MAKSDTFIIEGNIADVVNKRIFPGKIWVENRQIINIEEGSTDSDKYILPGLIDAHVHIESSMLVPAEFARLAVVHGTIGTVSDPHEIANVLGVEGVEFMIRNGKQVPFRFSFGAPSCVPATSFETSGAEITAEGINTLLEMDDIVYLAEMMNYPGVIEEHKEVTQKIESALRLGKVIDGHAPGLQGKELARYVNAGISTDHECSSLKEALEKIVLGMKILIRQGSAAKDFDALIPLMATHPKALMLCSDDLHPDDLIEGHINLLVKKALTRGYDLFEVLRSATLNPKIHYGLRNGLLQKGDAADFIVVDNLDKFNILETYIDGILVASDGESLIQPPEGRTPNRFSSIMVTAAELKVPALGNRIRVIEAIDGEITTKSLTSDATIENDLVVSNVENDILKLVSVNRYQPAQPAIGFIKGFGLKHGAMASTVAHDSHNLIAIGTNDTDLARVINLVAENKGGIAVVQGNRELIMPLPVAGIMTTADGYYTADLYKKLDAAAKQMGSTLKAPFMTLSFMALLVIPELKISDKGLFDVKAFQPVSLFV